MLKELKRIVSNTCVCFTVCEFVLLIIAELMLKSQATSDTVVSFLGFKGAVLVLLAAFVFNVLGCVFRIKGLPRVIVRLIHYLLSMFCVFLLAVIVPGRFEARFVFVLSALATVIYIIISFIAFAFKKLGSKKSESAEAYSPVFTEKQDSLISKG